VRIEQLDERLVRYVAPNGLRVLTESLPGVRSAAVGLWVRAASVHEPAHLMGISHLLEHMVFKGTERRTPREIALELESRGGSLDAFTSRDHTAFQAHVLDADLPVAIEVITDLVRRPLLRQSDLELERNVILEEISSVHDAPDDVVFELHARALWPSHPYGYSILGTAETVQSITVDDLRATHAAGYYPGNCIITAAGNLAPDQLLTVLEREGWFEGSEATPPLPPVPSTPAVRGERVMEPRDSQQCHLVIGTDTVPSRDPRRYGFALISTVLGGGMSSRLFQQIREELGLAYAVFSFQQFYQTTGVTGVYLGTQAETAAQATDLVLGECGRLAREGLPAEDLVAAKQQLKGQIMLSLESPMSRMHRLGGVELARDRYRRLDEILAEIDAVTPDEVRAIGEEFFHPDRQTIVHLGPFGPRIVRDEPRAAARSLSSRDA
jgi:predicted Zn-dependent peptidase